MTFRKWLEQQKEREDLVGDFARDVADDPSFPNRSDKSGNAAHFEWMPDEVRERFDEVWREYQEERMNTFLGPELPSEKERDY